MGSDAALYLLLVLGAGVLGYVFADRSRPSRERKAHLRDTIRSRRASLLELLYAELQRARADSVELTERLDDALRSLRRERYLLRRELADQVESSLELALRSAEEGDLIATIDGLEQARDALEETLRREIQAVEERRRIAPELTPAAEEEPVIAPPEQAPPPQRRPLMSFSYSNDDPAPAVSTASRGSIISLE